MSRYNQSFPSINRGYMSAGIVQNRFNDVYHYEDIVTPTNEAIQSNVHILADSVHNMFSSNVQTNQFNCVQVSIDTFANDDEQNMFYVNIQQGHRPNKVTTSYRTPVKSRSNFFRNYPVQNPFVNVQLENPQSNTVKANVKVSLSKFTQFNPPTQLGDVVDFTQMSNLVRSGNDFYDDIARSKYESIELKNVTGYVNTTNTTVQLLSPIQILPNTSNAYAEVYCKSDSASDTMTIDISGDIDIGKNGREENNIQLQGLAQSAVSINRYKSIDFINFRGVPNTGNVTIYHSLTNKLINYVPKQTASLATVQQYMDNRAEGVLKEVTLDGYSTLTDGKIKAIIADGSTGYVCHWEARYKDGDIGNTWYPDLFIPSNHTVYLQLENETGGTDLDIVGTMKIIKYDKDPFIN